MGDYQLQEDEMMERENEERIDKEEHEIRWAVVPKAESTFCVINAETLRHPKVYLILYISTLLFQFLSSVVIYIVMGQERSDRRDDFEAWCGDEGTNNKFKLLAANKLIALLGAGMCCLNEVTAMTDALSQGIFMRPDLKTKAFLVVHSVLHFTSVLLIFIATNEVEYYESVSVDVYLNCVGLIFIFEIKHQAAQAFNMRLITYKMQESNLTAELDLLRESRLRDASKAIKLAEAVQTVRNLDNAVTGGWMSAFLRYLKLQAYRQKWAYEGETKEEQTASAISTCLRTIIIIGGLFMSIDTAKNTLTLCRDLGD
jgi:hypothetical protein